MTEESQPEAETTAVAVRNEVTAGGQVLALVPQTVDQAWRLAQALARSGLAPSSMSTPDKCLVAIMAGAEIGLPPFQAVQSFAVIGNRPVLWGDGALAVVRSKGFKVREWTVGAETDQVVAYCEVTRPDTKETIERRFSVEDAKRASLWDKAGPWKQYPQRMLQMRARSWALRDAAADVMRGFQIREEVEDYDAPAAPARATSGLRARLEANKKANEEGFNVERAAEGIIEPVADTQRPADDPPEGMVEVRPGVFIAKPPMNEGDTFEVSDVRASLEGGQSVPLAETPAPDDSLPADDQAPTEAATPASAPGMADGTSGTGDTTLDDDSDAEGLEGASDREAEELNRRVAEYMQSIDTAGTVTRVKLVRDRATALRGQLAREDKERADALEGYYQRRLQELSR